MVVKVHVLLRTPRSQEFIPGIFILEMIHQPIQGSLLTLPGVDRDIPIVAFGNLAPDHIAVKTYQHSGRGIPNEQIAQTHLGIPELQKLGWELLASVA